MFDRRPTRSHDATVPVELAASLKRRAKELGVPFGSLVLAAHAKVLGALSGEEEVGTGYVVAAGAPPSPLRMTLGPRSWRELVLAARRSESELLSGGVEPAPSDGSFETTFDPGGDDRRAAAEKSRPWTLLLARDGSVLRVWYRTDAVDPVVAARIAGYHLAALGKLAADPDAEHRGQSLLSADERRLQVEGLSGPLRELPDLRLHEMFELRVRDHPNRIAAIHGETALTYGRLNARANRLARALRTRGLDRENAVAVVTERNLDWMAAVLAILKAGGAYLPLEPRLPADRIAKILSRADCRYVVTERASGATLDRALKTLPGLQTLAVESPREENGDDLDVEVGADQLAYIFFTSGSTGEPKGAMCEHAGMLNHVLAKIRDLGIGEGRVVAQTAPQGFDISLWQLLAAPLAGGTTLIVEQEEILDVGRFLDTIARHGVDVLQVVPSYLEVLLAHLERFPRPLPDLRCACVTGEALKVDLARRWFETFPHIKLVNAYGLTETSDDTNHEVLDRVPDLERVPIGSPIPNVRVYVVDETLSLVPLGAPGELVFSGVCVGRGYVNDPERTHRAFLSDPHVAGGRLYRSGDYGRWLPDGRLEFLGRRDTQVKVSGFRIEIGEIENVLARVRGVRDAAVVVVDRADGGRHLVAFQTGLRVVDADENLRERLGESLPEYMIPSSFHWLDVLPLNDRGKLDRAALTRLARDLDGPGPEREGPRTPTERRLASAWAEVLALPTDRVGRTDDFFDLGGTSLTAVRLAIRLNREVTLAELVEHPVLADLASLLDGRAS